MNKMSAESCDHIWKKLTSGSPESLVLATHVCRICGTFGGPCQVPYLVKTKQIICKDCRRPFFSMACTHNGEYVIID